MGEKIVMEADAAREMLYDGDPEYCIVSEKIVGTRRWSTDYELIIRRVSDNKYFQGWFSRGSTECQDERPWEYNEPEFVEVVPVTETTIVYKAVL